jgi:hypothetical protein
VVRTVDYSTYETEVDDDFDAEVVSNVHDLYWEEGFTWPRVDSEINDEEVIDYELVSD